VPGDPHKDQLGFYKNHSGVTRREFIQWSAAGAAGLGLGGTLFAGSARSDSSFPNEEALRDVIDPCFDESPVGPPFTFPLPIAPAIAAAADEVIHIRETRGDHQFVPRFTTPIWGYEGMVPGPTILARKGIPTTVVFHNELPPGEEPGAIIIPDHSQPDEDHEFLPSSTVVHLHGINADSRSDGYAEDRRVPGESSLTPPHLPHRYPNNEYQRPATLWYHDHSVHITSLHIYRGLAGFYILQDAQEDALGLPRGYGVHDIPLVLKDVMIDPRSGRLIYDNCSHMGAYGDVMTVNGKQQPKFSVGQRKYRFRTLNGSDSRQYVVAFRQLKNLDSGPDEPFYLIGTDHGLLPAPEITTFFHTTPSERYEFVFDFAPYPPGTRIVMVNRLIDPEKRKLFQLMAFDVDRVDPEDSVVPPVLRPAEHPADAQKPSQTRFFQFNRQGGYFSINSKQFDPNRVDAFPVVPPFPAPGTTEEWILETESGGWGHPVHIHLGRFRVMKVEGRRPRPGELTGFKDTVWVGPNQRITVWHQFWDGGFVARVGRERDNRETYVFHCHNGSHEDHDMMSQFEILPG
jgi:spore coat protein A, manganese oxidase